MTCALQRGDSALARPDLKRALELPRTTVFADAVQELMTEYELD